MLQPVQDFAVVILSGCGAVLLLTPLVAQIAAAVGWMDRPDGERKLHLHPVPTVGGVAVFGGFAVAAASLEAVTRFRDGKSGMFLGFWGPLVAAAFLVMIVGLVDDARGVRPATKLAVQTVAAGYLFYSGFRIDRLSSPLGGVVELGVLALPVTLVWLVGMSNAINLIDGLDGLAAGLALVATLGLLAAALYYGRWETALVAGALAGALLGFLPYNFNPARVFLGDCGALPVGMILAAIAIKGAVKASAVVAIAVPLLALALPILDVVLAILRRFVRRKPVFEGDHDHIHHRLLNLGLTPRKAVVTLYGVATLFTALSLAIAMGPKHVVWAAAALVLLLGGLGVRALGYWEVTEIQKTVVSRLAAGLRASGDAALRGLQLDLDRIEDLERGWARASETAWQIGFDSLCLVPEPSYADRCPELRANAPDRLVRSELKEAAGTDHADWTIEVLGSEGKVATIVARRPLQTFDFDPRHFASVLRLFVLRLVVPVLNRTALPAETAADAVSATEPSS